MINWVKLGMVTLDVILKLSIQDPTKSAIADGTMKIFDMLGESFFEQRKLHRQREAIADKIAASCNTILDYHPIEEERKAAIIEDIVILNPIHP